MVKRISMDVHGYRVSFADGGEVWLNDNDVLYFGDSLDVQMKWDGTNLVCLPLTNDAGSFNIGDGTTNMDFKLFAPNAGQFMWDASANVLYIIATSIMAYGSTLAISPGGSGKLSFYNEGDYIQSYTPGVLRIGAGSYIYMASKVIMFAKLQLQVTATPATVLGEMYIDSADALITYAPSGATEYKCLVQSADGHGGITGNFSVGGKLKLGVTTVVATVVGQLYLDSNDAKLTYNAGAGIEYKCVFEDNNGNVTLPVGGKLKVHRNAVVATSMGQFYFSTSTGFLTFHDGANERQIMDTGLAGAGAYTCRNFLRLFNTTTNGDTRGQIWYHTPTDTLRYWDGSTIKVISAT